MSTGSSCLAQVRKEVGGGREGAQDFLWVGGISVCIEMGALGSQALDMISKCQRIVNERIVAVSFVNPMFVQRLKLE